MSPLLRKSIIALLIVALIAPIKFSVFGVPFILQSLAIFSVSAILGVVPGLIISISYLLLGAVGVPIFAGYSGGLEKLLGPTAGFLWSFPAVAAYLAWQCKVGEQSAFHYITYFFRAHVLWLIPGLIVLYLKIEGVDLVATTIKLMPDLLVKSLMGGMLSYYLIQKLDLDPYN